MVGLWSIVTVLTPILIGGLLVHASRRNGRRNARDRDALRAALERPARHNRSRPGKTAKGRNPQPNRG